MSRRRFYAVGETALKNGGRLLTSFETTVDGLLTGKVIQGWADWIDRRREITSGMLAIRGSTVITFFREIDEEPIAEGFDGPQSLGESDVEEPEVRWLC